MTGAANKRRFSLRIVAALLVIALIVAIVLANHYRDSIALEVANRVLADSDIRVTDVSVASIRADNVRFEALLLELASGTRLRVEGITLPVKFRGFANSALHIESVTVTPGDGPTEALRLADSLQAFLAAPLAMPGGTVIVDELQMAGLPGIVDLGWYADLLNPTLRASIGEFDLFLTLTPVADDGHRGTLRVLSKDDAEAVMLAFRLLPQPAGYDLTGTFALRFEPLLPVLHAIGAVPGDLSRLAGSAAGNLRTEITETLPVAVEAEVEPVVGLQLDYRESTDRMLHITVKESSPLHAKLSYPSLDWDAAAASLSLAINGAGFDVPPVRLTETTCRSGVHCRTNLAVAFDRPSIGLMSMDRLTVSVNSLDLSSNDGDWQAASTDATAVLKNPSMAGHRVVAPRVNMELTASNERLAATLRLATAKGGFSARAKVDHDLSRETGVLRVSNATLDFGTLSLAHAILDWEQELDVTSGQWRVDGTVNWAIGDAGFAYTGSTRHVLDGLDGRYRDTGFVGLDSDFTVALDWQADPVVSPATVEVGLVDIGFPIEKLRGRITPDLGALAADIDSVSMTCLGGEVRIDPFRYEFERETNKLLLHARGIQLPLMVALADLEAVQISGSVSGEIPVTLKNGMAIVEGGHVENDAPGGSIRYGAASGIVDEQSQLGIVTRTLRNFEYQALTSDVNYDERGDLKLKMRITGTNPDVDPLQPVVLNLSVEDNVPQLLRSLQAARSIEDVLEKRLAK